MDKIRNDDEFILQRYACDCGCQGHSLDVVVELTDEGSRLMECSLNLYMTGRASLSWRIKQAWKCLKGGDDQLADFVVRPEDIPHLIDILKRAVTNERDNQHKAIREDSTPNLP